MRRLLILILLVSLLPVGVPTAANDDVVFTGSGWGHGVGMSQYGARGMAAAGSSVGQILGHYYQGTTVGSVGPSTVKAFVVQEERPLWVGLMQSQTTVTFTPRVTGATLCFEEGAIATCLPTAAGVGESWRFRVVEASTCTWERQTAGTWTQQGDPGPCRASVTPTGGSGEIDFTLLGRRFGNGILRLRRHPSQATVHAVWQTALEPYLRGIAEMPSSWSATALQAQAIAARSYAVARVGWRGSAHTFTTARQAACYCNLYMTTNDQQFLGKAAEAAAWVAAVSATSGQIVVSGGKVAETFYSSSSGGRTEHNQHYWGGSAISYLQGVDDAAAHTPAAGNPHSAWTAVVAPGTVAAKVGLDTLSAASVTARHPSGSAATVEFRGTKGGQSAVTTLTGNQVRSLFGLRSQYLSVDWGDATSPTPTTVTTPTTTTTTTTTTVPATTTTSTPTTSEGSTPSAPDETSTTAPDTGDETGTTSTTTTTTTTTTGPDEPTVTVAPPGGGGTGPGPITNAPPEPPGTPEDIAPPPPPAPEAEPLTPGVGVVDTPLGSFRPFGPIPEPTPEALETTTTTIPAEPLLAPAVEVTMPPPPQVWRVRAYEVVAAVATWVVGIMRTG